MHRHDPRTDQLLSLLPADLTAREYALLALACADHAGLSEHDTHIITDAIDYQDGADAAEAIT